ncbi:MAG: type 1 glutamine amidotransferase [Actinomycetota bacterium]|nr:MAG: hypothetical protein FD171_1345 [Actinomycetota bacterium]MDP3629390.1 type 1 glutamine amidotransferase [Actinomycetota bacterium]
MMRVAIIEHASFEGAGAIGAWARERGNDTRTVDALRGDFPTPDQYDLLVVLGGPMGAGDEALNPWLAAEKRAIRSAVDSGALVLGVCLGAQILADVLGAKVSRNPEPEIGWFPVVLNENGRRSKVFGGLPVSFVAGQWHGDTFGIPGGAILTASSDACVNQAFEFDGGRVVGVQFHLEWTARDVEALVANCGADLVPATHVVKVEKFIAGERVHGPECRRLLYSLLDAMTQFG